MRPSSAAALFLLILASPGLAQSSLTVTSAQPGALRPGERVAIRWQGLPDGVEETELLLSLDGGQKFSVRLTESVSPESGYYEWTVPNLPSRSARLALRVGAEGREEISLESDLFEIAAGQRDSTSLTLRSHRGELWALATAFGGPTDDGFACGSLDASPSFQAPLDSSKDALPSAGPGSSSERAPKAHLTRKEESSTLRARVFASRPVSVSPPLRI